MTFTFDRIAAAGAARAGVFATAHGRVETPAFMAVGTAATVKALDPLELEAMGCQMILANTYHLHLRPGDELVRSLGGVHRFMGWDGPMLTDSGGFQVFSLESLRTVSEDGVEFRSHIDGSRHRFTPESVMQIERNLGADVIMQFDHVIPGRSAEPDARDASERSIRWLVRCRAEFELLGGRETGDEVTAVSPRKLSSPSPKVESTQPCDERHRVQSSRKATGSATASVASPSASRSPTCTRCWTS